jgi:hypothetical protein
MTSVQWHEGDFVTVSNLHGIVVVCERAYTAGLRRMTAWKLGTSADRKLVSWRVKPSSWFQLVDVRNGHVLPVVLVRHKARNTIDVLSIARTHVVCSFLVADTLATIAASGSLLTVDLRLRGRAMVYCQHAEAQFVVMCSVRYDLSISPQTVSVLELRDRVYVTWEAMVNRRRAAWCMECDVRQGEGMVEVQRHLLYLNCRVLHVIDRAFFVLYDPDIETVYCIDMDKDQHMLIDNTDALDSMCLMATSNLERIESFFDFEFIRTADGFRSLSKCLLDGTYEIGSARSAWMQACGM